MNEQTRPGPCQLSGISVNKREKEWNSCGKQLCQGSRTRHEGARSKRQNSGYICYTGRDTGQGHGRVTSKARCLLPLGSVRVRHFPPSFTMVAVQNHPTQNTVMPASVTDIGAFSRSYLYLLSPHLQIIAFIPTHNLVPPQTQEHMSWPRLIPQTALRVPSLLPIRNTVPALSPSAPFRLSPQRP